VGRILIGSRGRARLVALVAAVTLTAGPAVVLDATSATSASAGPKGYTTISHDPGVDPDTCQLASVDLGAGGAVTPIGPSFTFNIDGCPFDLAIRAGDARIWAVIQPNLGAAGVGTLDPAFPGATGNDEPVPATDGPVAPASPSSAVLVTIDPTTGVRTPVGALGFAVNFESGALAFDAAGTLWFYSVSDDPQCALGLDPANFLGQCLYRLDPATGNATLVARGPVLSEDADVNNVVFGGTASCENVLANTYTIADPVVGVLNTVDTTTAALTPKPTTYAPNFLLGLERDAAGTLWGIGKHDADPEATFTIDPVTGAATKVADLTPVDTEDIVFGLAIAGLTCPVELAPRFTG